jgi:hypothetical protein
MNRGRAGVLAFLATGFVVAGAAIDNVVVRATEGHPHARRAVYAVEDEATRILRHGFAATGRCGVERWPEKTLASSDPASASLLVEPAHPTTIPALRLLPVPTDRAGQSRSSTASEASTSSRTSSSSTPTFTSRSRAPSTARR